MTYAAPNDILYGTLKMHQPEEGSGPRVNVDTILLAHYARVPARARILEMGCAQGAISLILAKRRALLQPGRRAPKIEGIDINPDLIELAQANAQLNGLSEQTAFAARDLRDCKRDFAPESYDAVVMNPPYDEPGRSRPSQNPAMSAAMHGDQCTLADVTSAAKYLLRNGGKLFLVLRAKRLGEIFELLGAQNVKPKRICPVHPKPDRAASVVLIEAVRAAGDGLIVEPPLFIYGPDGAYTERLLAAYRIEGASCPS